MMIKNHLKNKSAYRESSVFLEKETGFFLKNPVSAFDESRASVRSRSSIPGFDFTVLPEIHQFIEFIKAEHAFLISLCSTGFRE